MSTYVNAMHLMREVERLDRDLQRTQGLLDLWMREAYRLRAELARRAQSSSSS